MLYSNIFGGNLTQLRRFSVIIVIGFIILTVIGLVWVNYRMANNNKLDAGFLVQWISMRSLVIDGNDPYSEQVSDQIQNTVEGEYSFEGWNTVKYTSPLFTGFIVLPFAFIANEALAHGLWSMFQVFAIFTIMLLGLRITTWRPAWFVFLSFSLFTIFSYHVVIPWINGGPSIWAAFFLVLAVLLIITDRNEVSGFFLALAMIQPVMVILPIFFILIWAGSQKRKLLVFWFFVTLFILTIVGSLIVPDWILQYLRILYNFKDYFAPGSPGVWLSNIWPGLGQQVGWVLSGICVVILIFEWWFARKKDIRWFIWTLCLTLVISQWIGIPTSPMNYIGLVFVLVFISAMLSERWPKGGQWVAVIISTLLFVWEWGLFYVDLTSTQLGTQSNLLIPLPLVLLIGLYWVRWWAIKPRKLLLEEPRFGKIE